MFHDIKILVAESDHVIERMLSDCLTALSFTVVSANSISTCMDRISDDSPDILLLDEELVNGTSQIILDYWISRCHGPVMVFAPSEQDAKVTGHSHPLLGKGVWNVLTLDKAAENAQDIADMQALNTAILRYAQIVEMYRACHRNDEIINKLRKTQKTLWISTIALALSFVAYAGPDVLPRVIALIFGG